MLSTSSLSRFISVTSLWCPRPSYTSRPQLTRSWQNEHAGVHNLALCSGNILEVVGSFITEKHTAPDLHTSSPERLPILLHTIRPHSPCSINWQLLWLWEYHHQYCMEQLQGQLGRVPVPGHTRRVYSCSSSHSSSGAPQPNSLNVFCGNYFCPDHDRRNSDIVSVMMAWSKETSFGGGGGKASPNGPLESWDKNNSVYSLTVFSSILTIYTVKLPKTDQGRPKCTDLLPSGSIMPERHVHSPQQTSMQIISLWHMVAH